MSGTFGWEELTIVAVVGALREVSALKNGRPTAHDADERRAFDYHVQGVAGEVAVAQLLDRYWRPLARDRLRFLPGDVGDVQVRTTSRPNGRLIVHRGDPDDARFYLVISALPNYRIVGWILGRDAKRDEWWDTTAPHPAFFVPQSALQPAEEEAW